MSSKQIEENNGQKRWATVIVDWDGTCVTEEWPDRGDWVDGAIDGLRAILDLGYRVRIHSCRTNTRQWSGKGLQAPESRKRELDYIMDKLDSAGLSEVEVCLEDKPPAVWYIDDRAGFDGNWKKVVKRLGS